ncbi:putative hydrolase or acyltransferase of alpha/beta superfamily [Mycobacterium sp. JS623]|uniref:alpha/beta fold hydrolase n=1 Tax=Mycobacterium sp. JS623 TaxID=212767 RepID=UPI0002A5A4A8|nr:alpha/beta hydrolase [Mycobacterium sp. JS623]AGB22235.1 putative hydrolase or acyltransferase of alpha/beta superfamily [Mycobacterium sp. JS623]
MDRSASASVVLVHGGMLGPWMRSDVATMLERQGLSVRVPDLPSMGSDPAQTPLGDFYADAAEVRRVLDQLQPPVVVCGHSYGGAVITEAAAGPHPAVTHLVYLAAAIPDKNQSIEDAAAATSDHTGLAEVLTPVGGLAGTIMLEPDQAISALFHDCTDERAREAAAQLRPMNPAGRFQPLTAAAWRDLPSTLVRGSHDRIPEILTAVFLDCGPEVLTLPTGHCPNWSRPDLVAERLLRCVEKLIQPIAT